jgi:hypothetical protein
VKSSPPSKSAHSREFAKLQGNSRTAIFDGSFVKAKNGGIRVLTIAPPIQIYHPVFQEFTTWIDRGQPDPKIIDAVSEMVTDMGEIRDEKQGAAALCRHLENILGVEVVRRLTIHSRHSDGFVSVTQALTSIPVIIMEYKRSIGEGGCDPLVQGAYSVLNYWAEDKVCHLLIHIFTSSPIA